MPKKTSIWTFFLGTLLSACGGGGGGADAPAPEVLSGVLIDSPVSGMSYRSASQSGVTDASGHFNYRAGETVTFSIGNVQFPPVPGNSTVTPLDMAGTADHNNPVVSNILVLLQSLDEDGNPGNGIAIPAGVLAAATSPISFNAAPTAFAANPEVLRIVASAGTGGRAPVTVAAATANFLNTLNGSGSTTRINVAPFAVAGSSQAVFTGATATLSGAASTDANGDPLTYAWTLTSRPAGSIAFLTGSTTVNPTLVPDVAGTYIASLVVNDGALNSAAATVTVTAAVLNVAPSANAGPAQSVVTGSTVTLSGAASNDPNGDPITYVWSLATKPAGSVAALTGATTVNPTFVPDVAGNYVFSLMVSDGRLDSATPSTVTITAAVANVAPVANPGANQDVTIALGAVVTLDGSASSDANGDTLSYAWTFVSKPQNSTAVLERPTTASPTFAPDVFGAYVLGLAVNDGKVTSGVSNVTVTVHALNAPPVANAGAAQSVATGSTVTLTGAASNDANGDLLSYAWTITSKPVGSTAALTGAATVNPSFLPDVAGSYVFSLTVNDGTVNSTTPSTVTVTAFVPNAPPVANAGTAQSVATGATVSLSGASSSDANGDTLTYAWSFVSKPNGSTATISGGSTVNPSFVADLAGSYVLSLTVNDGQANSAAASNVTVSAFVPNAPPVANAGVAQGVTAGATVTLNGAGSSDANGDALTYAWTFVSKPAGSGATLNGAATVNPSFVADAAGSYVVSLVVNDGQANSAAASNMTVTATAVTTLSLAASATITTGGYTGQGVNDLPVPGNTGVMFAGAAKPFGPYLISGLAAPTTVTMYGTLSANMSIQVNSASAASSATVSNGDIVTLFVDLAAFATANGPLPYGQVLQPRIKAGLVTITFGNSGGSGGILLCTDPTLPPNVGNTVCQ